MNQALTGSCYCGAITFEAKSEPRITVNCHCDQCKGRNGSVFSTYMAIPEKSLEILSGADKLTKYALETEGEKYFCADCGSPIYNKNYKVPRTLLVFYGVVNNPDQFPPNVNVYSSSKHDWVDKIGQIKTFAEGIAR